MDKLTAAILIVLGWTLLVVVTADYRTVQRLQEAGAFGRQPSIVEKEEMRQIHSHSLLAAYVDLGVVRTALMTPDHLSSKLAMNGRMVRTWPGMDVVYRQSILLGIAGRTAEACEMWRLSVAAYPSWRSLAREQIDGLRIGTPRIGGLSDCASR